MREYSEKRDFIRMVLDCDLSYSVLDSDEPHNGKACDLSGKGMRFISDQEFSEGTMLEVRLNPKDSFVPGLHAIVKVMRVMPDIDGGYQVGVEICEMKS